MRIILCTVPHSGTQFFTQLIGRHFPQDGFDSAEAGKPGFCPVHVWGGYVERIRKIRPRVVLVTTERDPEMVRKSWVNRGRKMETLERCWEEYADLLTLDPFVLSVDAPDRDRRLRDFGKLVGVEFETDWTPVNAWRG